MNKDLIIGIVVSLALHATFLGAFNRKPPPPPKIVKEEEPVVQFEMPPLEEEPEDKVEELTEEVVENIMAPPSLVDLPSVVPVNAFTQPLPRVRIIPLAEFDPEKFLR